MRVRFQHSTKKKIIHFLSHSQRLGMSLKQSTSRFRVGIHYAHIERSCMLHKIVGLPDMSKYKTDGLSYCSGAELFSKANGRLRRIFATRYRRNNRVI